MYESEEEDYYEPVRTNNDFRNNYIEYESNGDKYKTLLVEEYLDKGEWKIQLTMEINFISSKDSHETRTMHANRDNTEIMIGN